MFQQGRILLVDGTDGIARGDEVEGLADLAEPISVDHARRGEVGAHLVARLAHDGGADHPRTDGRGGQTPHYQDQ